MTTESELKMGIQPRMDSNEHRWPGWAEAVRCGEDFKAKPQSRQGRERMDRIGSSWDENSDTEDEDQDCRLPTGDTADCQSALRGGLGRLVADKGGYGRIRFFMDDVQSTKSPAIFAGWWRKVACAGMRHAKFTGIRHAGRLETPRFAGIRHKKKYVCPNQVFRQLDCSNRDASSPERNTSNFGPLVVWC